MRRLSVVLMLALIAISSVAFPAGSALAATFRTHVARVPETPTSTQAARVWMDSDTALGETAGIEYNVGSSYVKVLGTYDTSYPGASWRADIPAQPNGTLVRYQLFTRNQSGSDYGFSGFNWSYTVNDPTPAGDIAWNEVLHDSLDSDYRSAVGPATPGQTVKLRLRAKDGNLSSARVRVWNDRANTETYYPMALDTAFDGGNTTYDWWYADVPTGSEPTILYYFFELNDRSDQDFYVDDDPKFLGGGRGTMSDAYDDMRSFQITVYDPAFSVPSWMQRAIIYQIFPDRFRDGDPSNNPQAGRFSYGANVSIVRSNDPEGDWNTAVCDPRASGTCEGRYGDNFYGGDLAGITQKIEDGYFDSLGVNVLYLNPIFRAPSNHKYDTANFMEIDPDFGTLQDFQAMVAAANQRGIRIMLDGVFNHTSSDSPYFDRYGRYAANGTINDVDGGTDDDSGACEAVSAQYRSWFYFEGDSDTTINNPGKDGSTTVRCADASGNFTTSYEAWYGYSSLPKIRSSLPTVRDYFYGGAGAVGPYWTRQGASGWRFDVGADVDPGLTNDPGNNYWEGFRAAVRSPSLSGKTDTVMLGEEWGDASAWLLGNEWDSVMNYRFRSAVLSWLFTGCTGNGCTNGTKFQENDSNDNSSSGSIGSLSPSLFNARLRSIAEDYPEAAFKAMMNLEGSHDTQRLRFLLKKINNDNDAAAVQRMKEWWLFAFSYAGAPTLYYGDEVGLSHDGVWDGSQYQDDPYNRAPFPWNDTPGAYVADTSNLLPFAREMASIRQSYRALQDGDVQHGLLIDDARQLYGFGRTNGQQTALVLLNRSGSSQSATFSGLNAAPYNLADGTTLVDAISGTSYTVSGGAVTVSVTPTWGAVLLEASKIETPAAPANVSAAMSGGGVVLTWPAVTRDGASEPEVVTSYEVYRDGSKIATVAPPALGSAGAQISYTHSAGTAGSSYVVRALNAAGKGADSAAVSVPVVAQATSLAVDAASGTYGGTTALRATLTAGSAGVSGKTVAFTLNGASVGSAATDASGVATLSGISLSGIDAGGYPSAVGAAFAGTTGYLSSSGSAALTVGQSTATLSLNGLTQTYDGSPKSVTVTTSPAGLAGVAVTYNGSTTPPAEVGSYAVAATLTNANYQATNSTGTLVIGPAPLGYSFTGFFAPVDNLPTLNVVKAGSAVPVKFSLGGDFGLSIFAAGFPKVEPTACASGSVDAIEETVNAGASSLSYDPSTMRYTYVWKTNKSWRGCGQLVIKLADGTIQRASFEFRK